MRWRYRLLTGVLAAGLIAGAALAVATRHDLMPLPATLNAPAALDVAADSQVLARDGTPLNRSFGDAFNRTAIRTLSDMPLLLRQAFLAAEDRRFWEHGGADWLARFAALWGNLRAGRVQRGASTIGEQAARILQARPRTYWSHWIAGRDAQRLLDRFGHARVFAFYLNQVPYAARRRGVVQAARYYFGRELEALNPAEQLSLAVLVRSPARYDPRRHPDNLRRAVDRLAERMVDDGFIDADQVERIHTAAIRPGHKPLQVRAGAFVAHIRAKLRRQDPGRAVIRTTLDPVLQNHVQKLLRRHVELLQERRVHDAAALVVDNDTGAIRAWATAPGGTPYGIDPVTTPRQPGSALKPFVYAQAMAQLGWQPDHVLDDSPLVERIDTGVHSYRNYSGDYYGRVSLRYALGNSLNIPVVRTAQAVGVRNLLELFWKLGITSFTRSASHYGAAIALGDGEVSLYELVQAYATLARRGQFQPLHARADARPPAAVEVLPGTVTSVIGDILSDPGARRAEFGRNSILNMLYPTAAKTGTSSDYRDAWTVAYDNRYTVGVWVGRLDGGVTNGVTGSLGAAPVVRRIFAHLRAREPYAGLWLSPELERVDTCEWLGEPPCIQRRDWRVPITAQQTAGQPAPHAAITRPVPDEVLAIDPRVPRASQRLRMRLHNRTGTIRRVRWHMNGEPLPGRHKAVADWQLTPGRHTVQAEVWLQDRPEPIRTRPVRFHVRGMADAAAPPFAW